MIYVTLICLGLFIANMLIERRSLWSGVTLGLACASTLIFLLISIETSPLQHRLPWLNAILYLVLVGIIMLLLTGPLLLEITFLYNGIKLLRREGLSLTNALSLGLAIAIPLYLIWFPALADKIKLHPIIAWLPAYIGLIIFYLMTQVSLYTLASLLNLINLPQKKLDYIIVLGAGLIGKEVTPLLASRINKAIAVYRKHPTSKLIMSGGQGADELISEAEAMTNYALRQGIPAEDIILEDKATTTYENIAFSRQLMTQVNPRFAIVTNAYHLFRALLIARQQGLACIGYGAPSKFYFSLNAFVRELIAYLVISRKRHIIILAILLILTVLIHVFNVTILPQISSVS